MSWQVVGSIVVLIVIAVTGVVLLLDAVMRQIRLARLANHSTNQ